jgi:hypothetical protein
MQMKSPASGGEFEKQMLKNYIYRKQTIKFPALESFLFILLTQPDNINKKLTRTGKMIKKGSLLLSHCQIIGRVIINEVLKNNIRRIRNRGREDVIRSYHIIGLTSAGSPLISTLSLSLL